MKTIRKYQVLKECWMKAKEQGSFEIPCTSPEEAYRIRGELYRAVRRAKKERTRDRELAEAGDELSISYQGTTLCIYRRAEGPLIQRVEEVLEESSIAASISRLESLLSGDSVPGSTFNSKLYSEGEI